VAALRGKVDELDSFAYVVSHDLKEPLRAIQGFASLLRDDHAGALAPEAREYLDTVLDAAGRMGSMISDLLTLSRIGRSNIEAEAVDLVDVAADVLQVLRLSLNERHVSVSAGPLPVVLGCRAWLQEVLANLLSNAIKYNDKAEPHIELGCREPLEEVRDGRSRRLAQVFVRDNGPGIDPRFHEAVFDVFRRLDPPPGVEGSGAGLAIVRKVVEREGGRVWVESQPGQGATFVFTVPLLP
jgi:two-component system, chemotaxis family, sensor kinase Cph1